MIYLTGWGFLYFAIIVSALTNYRGKVFFALALSFIAIIAIFRGDVGTDTATYEHILLSFVNPDAWPGIEPGFFAIGWFLIELFGSSVASVRAISLIFFIFLFLFLFRADRNELFLLVVYIVPAFAYNYSMNALRIGIASAILMLAVQELRRRRYLSSSMMALATLLFHYSSFFSVVFISLSQRRWVKFSNFIALIFALAFAALIFYLNPEYFSYKITAYMAMPSPSSFSGLSKVVVILIIIFGVFMSKLPIDEKRKIIISSILLTVFFWWIASFTYAGLRFLDLISFALPVSLLATYSRLGLLFDMPVRIALLFGGFIAAAGVYRSFLLGVGQGPSPFLPYHFSSLLF